LTAEPETPKTRVLICDDHPVVRTGLRGMLEGQADFEVVGEAENGEEAVELAGRLRPDVILMDLRMPKLDGVSATARVGERWPDAHVLVLTTSDSGSDILRAVEAGATGYVLKDAPREELFRAVRAAAEGKPLLAPDVAAHLMDRVRWPSEEVLSGREIEVLDLVSQGKSNKEIAGALWISETTVKSHLLHVYNKLGASDRASAVAAALKRGILRL
jgi:DNA-binding NarL/FixJ family response regulator